MGKPKTDDKEKAGKATPAGEPAAAAEAAERDEAHDGAAQAQDGTERPELDADAGNRDPQAQAAAARPADPDEDLDEDDDEPKASTLVPMDNGQTEATDLAKALLIDACTRFGVDPTEQAQPRELASWKFYAANRRDRVPASVVIVTAGGVKLRHFAELDYLAPQCTEPAVDQDTEETLARIFGAFTKDPKTNEIRRIALPTDLALPEQSVTGHATTQGHRYRRGYLKEGGKTEADRRDKADRKKRK